MAISRGQKARQGRNLKRSAPLCDFCGSAVSSLKRKTHRRDAEDAETAQRRTRVTNKDSADASVIREQCL